MIKAKLFDKISTQEVLVMEDQNAAIVDPAYTKTICGDE